jgi:hypothetical protein
MQRKSQIGVPFEGFQFVILIIVIPYRWNTWQHHTNIRTVTYYSMTFHIGAVIPQSAETFACTAEKTFPYEAKDGNGRNNQHY